jgi:hypothetical protein
MADPKEDNRTDEEKEADREAEAYFKELHGDKTGNLYDTVSTPSEAEKIEAQKKAKEIPKSEVATVAGGAATGAYLTHKDAIRNAGKNFLTPAEGVYAPKAPTAGVPSALLDAEHIGAHVDDYDTMVERMMQSIRDEKNKPTGRQMESAHNWESNRQALEREAHMKQPGAKQVIINAGPQTPTRGGIAVPQHVAAQAEEDALRREAQKRVAEQTIQREKEAAQLAKQQAEAKVAQRAGIRSGVGKVGIGALGGALGAKDLYDVYDKYSKNQPLNEEDYLKMVGGLGGLVATIPTPVTEAIGLGLSGGALAYPYAKKALGYK